VQVSRLLAGIDDIEFCRFRKGDIVRHPVVQRIVDAYERESS
jgi:phosphate starvation-inducible PhoH-like protein